MKKSLAAKVSAVLAAAFVTVSDNFSLQLNVENLTDSRYYASASSDNNILPGKPLTGKISARIKF